jgi:hypothetical protein
MLGRLGVAFLWGMLLAHASWWAWHGSVFWGPRFLLVAGMPASFALAMHLSSRKQHHMAVTILLVFAVLWSVWVGVNATVIREGYPETCTAQASRYESLCWYVPEYSPLIYPLVNPKNYGPWDKAYFGYSAVVGLVLLAPMVASRVREALVNKHFRRV